MPPPGVRAQRLLLVGLGSEKAFDLAAYRKAMSLVTKHLDRGHAIEALCSLTTLEPKGSDGYRLLRESIAAVDEQVYRFNQCKSEAKPAKRPLKRLNFLMAEGRQSPTGRACHQPWPCHRRRYHPGEGSG